MLLIRCPHCGDRNSNEFSFSGEQVVRPEPGTDIEQWRRYLYIKRNVADWQSEQWFHVSGCRRFLVVERNTVTNEIRSVVDAGGLT